MNHLAIKPLDNITKMLKRRAVNYEADITVFESMDTEFHNHASLVSLNEDVTHSYDIYRFAIVSWHYSVYFK